MCTAIARELAWVKAQLGDLTVRRSRPHAYLLLARFSNLPTVWTNVLAGTIVVRRRVRASRRRPVVSCDLALYTAGMFLNDAFDRDFDARVRPDRPIPAGDVTRARSVRRSDGSCSLSALLLAGGRRHGPPRCAWGTLLAAAIVLYNYRHKAQPIRPGRHGRVPRTGLLRGGGGRSRGDAGGCCRGCRRSLIYVIALTWIAKLRGQPCAAG